MCKLYVGILPSYQLESLNCVSSIRSKYIEQDISEYNVWNERIGLSRNEVTRNIAAEQRDMCLEWIKTETMLKNMCDYLADSLMKRNMITEMIYTEGE